MDKAGTGNLKISKTLMIFAAHVKRETYDRLALGVYKKLKPLIYPRTASDNNDDLSCMSA